MKYLEKEGNKNKYHATYLPLNRVTDEIIFVYMYTNAFTLKSLIFAQLP